MSGHRRTAVVLHGLQAQDRQWMLAELPGADQAIVRSHLAELEALGFQPGPDVLAAVQDLAASVAMTADAAVVSDVSGLQHATLQQMQTLLQDEPAALVARLLALQNWPWQEALLAALPAPQRQRIRMQQPMQPAPALDTWLQENLQSRLQALPRQEPLEGVRRSKPLPWWQTVWGALSWKR
ncbi:MAG: hypothetical protein RL748_512 [Pseudomonadota bacterium]|jgi:hypothetical protein